LLEGCEWPVSYLFMRAHEKESRTPYPFSLPDSFSTAHTFGHHILPPAAHLPGGLSSERGLRADFHATFGISPQRSAIAEPLQAMRVGQHRGPAQRGPASGVIEPGSFLPIQPSPAICAASL